MKITDVRAAYPKWKFAGAPGRWQRHFWQIVVRVDTDKGVVGLGYGGGGKPGVEVVNSHLRELLVGRTIGSVADIRSAWDDLYAASIPYGRKGLAVMALSGVDLALWDLLGKAETKPVYDLIGTRLKERVRAYASGNDPEWYASLGITAHKFSGRMGDDHNDYDQVVDKAIRTRQYLGAEALVMIDAYMSWDSQLTANMADRLADLNIYWFEDLLTPDDLDEQALLKDRIKPILLAGGEHEFTRHGFADIAKAGALDIWQPDITWCGGITEGIRIVELATEIGIPVVPHRGGEIWGLHLIVSSNCEDLAEWLRVSQHAPRDELWFGEPEIEDGTLLPSNLPGFGVELNEAMI